jgi:hypothetical protein
MRALFLFIVFAVASCSENSNPAVIPEPEPVIPQGPPGPVITAPERLAVGTEGTASIPAQDGATYAWSVEGGEILSGATTPTVTFRSDTSGPIRLSARVTDAGGKTTEPGQWVVRSYAIIQLLKNHDVQGSPATGRFEFESPDTIRLNYTPVPHGHRAVVEIDGVRHPDLTYLVPDRHQSIWIYSEARTGELFADMIVVPADPSLVAYPSFFSERIPGEVRVGDPYCGAISPTIAYPASYLGAFPLPEAHGAPLPPHIGRGVALKDYWAAINNNPTTNEGCSGNWRAAVDETMRRVKLLGADHVAVYVNRQLLDLHAEPLQFACTPGAWCRSWSQISEEDLRWSADLARSHGLELHLYLQIGTFDHQQRALPNSQWRGNRATPEFMEKFFDAYEAMILHVASVAEEAGIPVMQMDWGSWWIDWSQDDYKEIWERRMPEIGRKIRTVYSGDRALSNWGGEFHNPALVAEAERLHLDVWLSGFSITQEEDTRLSVPFLRGKYLELIQNMAGEIGAYGKPTVFTLFAQSHRDFLLKGWVEDGFCNDIAAPGCDQREMDIDFSIQAMSYQALMEAISAQTAFDVIGVHVIGYWFADNILPDSSFPNLSQSFRNKPAEALMYQWFAR